MTAPATILLSANEPWNLTNFRKPVIRALQQAGFAVATAATVATDRDRQAAAQLEGLGCTFHAVAITAMGTRPLDDLRTVSDYVRLMRRIRPAAYLGWTIKPNIYGALAARWSGIPAILNISGLGTAFLETSAVARIARVLYRLSLGSAHTVLFQNADDRAEFVTRRLVRPDQARLVNGSGVDLAYYQPRSVERDRRGIFLMIARLIGDKGVREYVEAARLLKAAYPALTFRLLGFLDVENRSAIARGELESWLREGIIDFCPAVDDVRPHIADADCIVLPSYREGTSRVLLEAAAMARPVVTTDVPGCRDVVQDRVNGFLCRPCDAPSLAAAMRAVLSLDDDRWSRMGRAGRALVSERYSEDAVVSVYLDALESAGIRVRVDG